MTCEDRHKYPTTNKTLPKKPSEYSRNRTHFKIVLKKFLILSHCSRALRRDMEREAHLSPYLRRRRHFICFCLPAPAEKGQLPRVSLRPSVQCCWCDRMKATATPYFVTWVRGDSKAGTTPGGWGLQWGAGQKQWEEALEGNTWWPLPIRRLPPVTSHWRLLGCIRPCLRWGPKSLDHRGVSRQCHSAHPLHCDILFLIPKRQQACTTFEPGGCSQVDDEGFKTCVWSQYKYTNCPTVLCLVC